MNKNLVRSVGSTSADNLIVKLTPSAETFGVTIRKEATEEVTLKRGTILAKSSRDGLLVVLGTEAAEAVEGGNGVEAQAAEVLAPYAVLADDVAVGTGVDAVAVAYRSGNFNRKAVIVADGYTLTDADEDELRKNDIIFTDAI